MDISDDLKLVLPLYDGRLYAYHTPLSPAAFHGYYRLLAQAHADFLAGGNYFQLEGPRIAADLVRDKAAQDAAQRGDVDAAGHGSDAQAVSLFAELKRLTVIGVTKPEGWVPLPVDAAIREHALDPDDWDEVLSELVFFTCYVALATHRKRAETIRALALLLGADTTSSEPTAFLASLPTSTPAAATPPATSSVPS